MSETPTNPPTKASQASPGDNAARKRKELFDAQFNAFWGGIGTVVEFKGGKGRNKIEWTVAEITTDWQAVRNWTKGGTRPMFIRVEREVTLAGNKRRVESLWTYTDALQEPKRKGRWHL